MSFNAPNPWGAVPKPGPNKEIRMAERTNRGSRALIPPPEQSFQEGGPRVSEAERAEAEERANVKRARLEAFDEALSEWVQLQNKEDALLEKHIAPIRDKKAKLKARLKADYDIPTEAFNARAALRRIELKAGNDEVVLAVNELFEATPVGESVDLEAALARVTAKKAEEAKVADDKKKAKQTETAL